MMLAIIQQIRGRGRHVRSKMAGVYIGLARSREEACTCRVPVKGMMQTGATVAGILVTERPAPPCRSIYLRLSSFRAGEKDEKAHWSVMAAGAELTRENARSMYVYRGPEARLASHSLGESVIRNVRYAAGDLKLGDWN